jgi:hypothetical protein
MALDGRPGRERDVAEQARAQPQDAGRVEADKGVVGQPTQTVAVVDRDRPGEMDASRLYSARPCTFESLAALRKVGQEWWESWAVSRQVV